MTIDNLEIINLIAGSYMCGVLAVMQFVQYPQMKLISRDNYPKMHKFHVGRMGFVAVPMLIELIVASYLVFISSNNILYGLNLTFTLSTWLMTLLVFVPMHKGLIIRRDNIVIGKIIKLNLLRTLLWHSKLLFAIWIIVK